MATDAYVYFLPYSGEQFQAESQVDFSKNKEPLLDDLASKSASSAGGLGQIFEIEEYGFDIEQTLNIGSQSSGAGAGKVTFNPFSITRKIDHCSTRFFEMACSGTAFKQVSLLLRKSAGGDTSGQVFLRFDFKLAAIKTISWSHDEESPKEEITFEYGGLLIRYCQQQPSGELSSPAKGGWNRVRNVRDDTTTPL